MKGKLIVIEGLDGSGKSTQIDLLNEYYNNQGIETKYIHFPMLNKGVNGTLIAEFLRGEFGTLENVHPKLVALLFANDRKEHVHLINSWLEEGYVVLADRYVNSNIAFQGAKLKDENEKVNLKNWILDYEYNYNQLPVPFVSIFLNVPLSSVKNSLENIRDGEDRAYLNGKEDIHENDFSFQEKVYLEYKNMVAEQEKFFEINCKDESGNFLDKKLINQLIISHLNL
jgi:dTMP kinase